jgi:hypothetical protein
MAARAQIDTFDAFNARRTQRALGCRPEIEPPVVHQVAIEEL